MTTLLVFDTETTGLNLHPDADLSLQPRAIEFAGALLDCDTGEVIERHTFLINPGAPLDSFDRSGEKGIITKLTGITDEMLVTEPSFAERLPALRRIFGSASAMLAHNLPFDRMIVWNELVRIGCVDFPWPVVELCTVGLYKELWGHNPNMGKLYAHVMGREFVSSHRAMSDVDALVEIVQKDEIWRFAAMTFIAMTFIAMTFTDQWRTRIS